MVSRIRLAAGPAHRLLVRLAGGPLRGVARVAHAVVARVVAWSFLVDRGASVYGPGASGRGELVYGPSDFDLVVVTRRDAERLRRHVERFERLVPGPPQNVLEIATCREEELGPGNPAAGGRHVHVEVAAASA